MKDSDYKTLKRGDKGIEVVSLKLLLAAKGFYPSSDDPVFYKELEDAVKLYQTTHLGSTGRMLNETEILGVVGVETWKALEGKTNQKLGLTPPVNLVKTSGRRDFLTQLKSRHEAGVGEVPKGSNWGNGVKECIKWNGIDEPIPWCNAEMNFDLGKAGVTPPWGKGVRVCASWNAARKAKMAFLFSEGEACPGDLFVILHKPLLASRMAPDVNGHIGAIAAIDMYNIITYEGNSDDRFRSASRSTSSLVGFIRLFPYEKNFKFGIGKWGAVGSNDR